MAILFTPVLPLILAKRELAKPLRQGVPHVNLLTKVRNRTLNGRAHQESCGPSKKIATDAVSPASTNQFQADAHWFRSGEPALSNLLSPCDAHHPFQLFYPIFFMLPLLNLIVFLPLLAPLFKSSLRLLQRSTSHSCSPSNISCSHAWLASN